MIQAWLETQRVYSSSLSKREGTPYVTQTLVSYENKGNLVLLFLKIECEIFIMISCPNCYKTYTKKALTNMAEIELNSKVPKINKISFLFHFVITIS